VFWDLAAPPRPGAPFRGPLDLASPGADRPIELLLMRQLASYLTTVIFLIGPDGSALFFNEPAERLVGLRFEEADPMTAEEWAERLQSIDETGGSIPFDERPLIVALQRQEPAHRQFSIRGFDQAIHRIEGLAFPLVGLTGRQLGAVGIFWENASS
jgi:PAS domain-containing protein